MTERRSTNFERRLRRITAEEPEQGRRGIFELFPEEQKEPPAEDAPLMRAPEDDTAA